MSSGGNNGNNPPVASLRAAFDQCADNLNDGRAFAQAVDRLVSVHAAFALDAALPRLHASEFAYEACIQRVEREPWLVAEFEAIYG